MGLVYADRVNQLKARVKAECQRRSRSGSVSSYGGSAYDYSVTPAKGGKLLQEHRDKIATPLNKINSNKVPTASNLKNVSENDFATMEAFTTTLEKRVIYDSSGTDCSGGCTGMCYGCNTTCTGSCSGSCSGGCSGCSGCGGSCSYSCSGSCDGCSGCGSSCSYSCSGSCDGGCSGSCGGECSYGCNSCGGCGGCGGCGNTCSGSCLAWCSNSSTT